MHNTKQFYDAVRFNSAETIMSRDIVVIKYNYQAPGSSLQSMTVGDYYIVRKTTYALEDVYEMLTHDTFIRIGTGPIRVKVNYHPGRFTEHKILAWSDANEFRSENIMLKPIISIAGDTTVVYISPVNGKRFDATHDFKIPAGISAAELCNLYTGLQLRGLHKIAAGISTKIVAGTGIGIVAGPGIDIIDPNDMCTYKTIASIPSDNGIIINNTGSTITFKPSSSVPRFIETDEQMERRIDNNITPVYRHTAPANTGVKDEYLLIN